MSDPYVREVGRVTDVNGQELIVGAACGVVMVGPYRFGKDGQERLAWLLNRAMWLAEQQEQERSDEKENR
jgi:hypothetical protein